MTATDRLRELLDERGVEYDKAATVIGGTVATFWHDRDGYPCSAIEGADDIPDGEVSVQVCVTPEQAIAATLGSGTCVNMDRETDAEWFTCSECNTELRVHEPFDAFSIHFCPNCGRKVVDE